MEKCLVCNREFQNKKSLMNHVWQTHKINAQEYHETYLKENWITPETRPEKFMTCQECGYQGINLTQHFKKVHKWNSLQIALAYRGHYYKLIDEDPDIFLKEDTALEKFIKLYIEENHSLLEVSELLHFPIKLVYEIKKEFSINKDQKLIMEDKLKKMRSTCLERYGVSSSTLINNQAKTQETYQQRYGVNWNLQTEDFKSKRILTSLNKYGVPHPHQAQEIINKTKSTCLERYGVTTTLLTPENLEIKHISESQKYVYDIIKKYYQQAKMEFAFGSTSYDIRVGKTLIEVDPAYTHNSTHPTHFNPDYITPYDYHLERSQNAWNHGYHCIHIFDWDEAEKIAKILADSKVKVYARNCKVEVVEDRKLIIDFINNNHLQGASSNLINKSSINLGLYYKDKLISVISFGSPRYNKNYQYELLRLCTSLDYYVVGGNQKLFKYFIDKYTPDSIISYCDKAKFKGNVYNKLGFRLHHTTAPTAHWWDGSRHITDALLRSRGADQLIGTNYGKGTSNEEIMIDHGFVQIYDCGQDVYEWKGDLL